MTLTDSGNSAFAAASAEWKLLLTETQPIIPNALTQARKLRARISGGPNNPFVFAISSTHRKSRSRRISSTRGEKQPAHSRRISLAAVSSFEDRWSSVIAAKVSTSTWVMPHDISRLRAFCEREQTVYKGG